MGNIARRENTALHRTMGDFVAALRKADLSVSPAESLDAMSALRVVGLRDRCCIKRSLSIVLAKTATEKQLFDVCFDRFFAGHRFNELKQLALEYQAAGSDVLVVTESQAGESEETDSPKRHFHRRPLTHHDSHLGHLLLTGDEAALLLLLMRAVEEVHLDQIKSLRERGLYSRRILMHMGMKQLNTEIDRLYRLDSDLSLRTAELLVEGKHYLNEKVTAYVEEQYYLLVDGSGQRFIVDAIINAKLTAVPVFYLDHVREAVRKLAHRIAKQHAKRRKTVRKGMLDIRKTMRYNLAYDGSLFDLKWKQIKLVRPKVYVLCDVSGSVKNASRFLLTFIYSLSEVLPNVRSFAFSNELGEVTELFSNFSLELATEMSLDDWGKGSTDYGQAFKDFKDLALRDIDAKSTILVLGDARNNYYDAGTDLFREMASKSHQVIWLNPEQRTRWDEGDSIMNKYRPYCTSMEVCNSLHDLERLAANILRSTSK